MKSLSWQIEVNFLPIQYCKYETTVTKRQSLYSYKISYKTMGRVSQGPGLMNSFSLEVTRLGFELLSESIMYTFRRAFVEDTHASVVSELENFPLSRLLFRLDGQTFQWFVPSITSDSCTTRCQEVQLPRTFSSPLRKSYRGNSP